MRRPSTSHIALALAAIGVAAVPAVQAVRPAMAAPAGPAVDDLSIATASGDHHFKVEVMRTRAELEQGLMFRRKMDPDRGMLFDFGTPQPVSMWMKNTYLPLDMVFIAADGRVVSVKRDAEPLSEAIIPSGGDVLGVLELNAGTAARLGVKAGDRVADPMFRP